MLFALVEVVLFVHFSFVVVVVVPGAFLGHSRLPLLELISANIVNSTQYGQFGLPLMYEIKYPEAGFGGFSVDGFGVYAKTHFDGL
jgi:hypothetical protein